MRSLDIFMDHDEHWFSTTWVMKLPILGDRTNPNLASALFGLVT